MQRSLSVCVLMGSAVLAGSLLAEPSSLVHTKGSITAHPQVKALLFVPFNERAEQTGPAALAAVAGDGAFAVALPRGNYLVVQHPPGSCSAVRELRLSALPPDVYLELGFAPERVTEAPGTTTTVERELTLARGLVGYTVGASQAGSGGLIPGPPSPGLPQAYLGRDQGDIRPRPNPPRPRPKPGPGGGDQPKPGGGKGGPEWPPPKGDQQQRAALPGVGTIPTTIAPPVLTTPLPSLLSYQSSIPKLPGGINLGAGLVCGAVPQPAAAGAPGRQP